MPIYNDGDTKVCVFGKGDIAVGTARKIDSDINTTLCLIQDTECNPIGQPNPHHIGLDIEDMNTQIEMIFDNVASIDVVISQLQVIRADLVKMQEEKDEL